MMKFFLFFIFMKFFFIFMKIFLFFIFMKFFWIFWINFYENLCDDNLMSW